MQVQQIGEAIGHDAERGAGDGVGVCRGLSLLGLEMRIVVRADAHKDAGLLTGQLVRRDRCVLQGLPTHLQEEALLRIHMIRLGWRNPEKLRVKVGHLLQEPAPAGVHLTRCAGIRIVECIHIPAGRGDLGDRVASLMEQLPELMGILGTWEPAPHADDRDRFVACCLSLVACCLLLVARETL